MDTGRLLLAVVLMIAVIVTTNILFPPPAPQQPPGGPAPAETTAVPAEPEAVPAEPEPVVEAAPLAEAAAAPEQPQLAADTVIVESPLYRYGFSTRGAALVRAELLPFESRQVEGPVNLVPPDAPALLRYRLRVGERIVDLRQLPFAVERAPAAPLAEGGGPDTLRFEHVDPAGQFSVSISYVFEPDRYVIGTGGAIRGLGGATPTLLLDMGPTLAVHEADPEEDRRARAYVFNSRAEGIGSVRLDKVDAQRVEEGPLYWVALRNKYFLLAVLPAADDLQEYFGGVIAQPVAAEDAALVSATLPVGSDLTFAFRIYAGPQASERLATLGYDFADVNPIGWRVFRPIIQPLAHLVLWALVGMRDLLGFGYGWILILFGVLIRLILWPLNAKAMRSQLKTMELQPRLKEIQEKYKGNPEQLQREMMKLYKEEGFNPFGGCLPMLIPFPVLITLFFVFQNTIEFRGVDFLWMPDLSRPDPFYILPVVLGISMFLMQWISLRSTPQQNPQAKMMMWMMPPFMVIIFLNLASGLNLYYAAQNLASIPQQIQIARERGRMRTKLDAK